MVDVTSWVNERIGKRVANPWGTYMDECVSLVQDWIVANNWPMRSGNAIQWADEVGNGWTWTPNTPKGVPPAGAICVFKVLNNPYGHVGIAMPGCTTSTLLLASQNWPHGNDTDPVSIRGFNYLDPLCEGWLTHK